MNLRTSVSKENTNKKNILFLMSGSISCYKACQVLSDLSKANLSVRTVLSNSANRFIGDATVEGLTGHAPIKDLWASGQAMDHIHLSRQADLIVLCPASANQINQMANGIAQDLIGNIFLAFNFSVPFLVFPAMNHAMIQHPATQGSIKKLQDWGLEFHGPAAGDLACGETGSGRLIEPSHIAEIILDKLNTTREIS